MIDYRLYLVTDEPERYRENWLENLDKAISGGVTCVQYRDTRSSEKVQYQRLLALKPFLQARHIPLIVNNHIGLALAIEAEGIHVGQSDLPPEIVRKLVGPRMEIGLSLTEFSQVAQLPPAGMIQCVGIGPVFDAAKTKADAAAPLGVEGFRKICEATPGLIHVAIGGITPQNAPALLDAGADGLAVVSAFSRSDAPRKNALQFFKMLRSS